MAAWGIEPNARRTIWPYLLGVYDYDSTFAQRQLTDARLRVLFRRLRRECELHMESRDGSNTASTTATVPAVESPPPDSPSEEEVDEPAAQGRALGADYDSARRIILQDVVRCRDPSPYVGVHHRKHSDSLSRQKQEIAAALAKSKRRNLESTRYPSFSHRNRVQTTPLSPSHYKFLYGLQTTAIPHASRGETIASTASTVAPITNHGDLGKDESIKDDPLATACRGLSDTLTDDELAYSARLALLLQTYAMYDDTYGYCQGMTDLVQPFAAVFSEDDALAFWCFARFMSRVRHNFSFDGTGVSSQLDVLAQILEHGTPETMRMLRRTCAAPGTELYFSYRMLLVLLRREMSFMQTLQLWEMILADCQRGSPHLKSSRSMARSSSTRLPSITPSSGRAASSVRDGSLARLGEGRSWKNPTARVWPEMDKRDDLLLYVIAEVIAAQRETFARSRSPDDVLRCFADLRIDYTVHLVHRAAKLRSFVRKKLCGGSRPEFR
eukprot:scaffold582_cov385-Prasinococcus_capsulatus_cf.AAC.13